MVPDGRYALTFNNGKTRFFKVNSPTKGRWAGYTFLSMLAANGGHGIESLDEFPVRDRAKRDAVMNLIAADPSAASMAFGKEIKACGVCGRALTDQDSRDAGIGPVCRGKLGW